MSGQAVPTTFEGVKTSPNLTLSLDRAREQARELHQSEVSIEHLLLALTDDPDATGSLEACGVDLGRLKTDIATYVMKSASDAGSAASGEPVSSPELRSMLDQAVDAAREAKRQEINSFIVLAAIVGQEQSQAASILQSHGFTFNEALEALKPRAARPEVVAEVKAAPVPAARPVARATETAPSASQVAEAMAQSADALPPLPTALPRVARAAPRMPAAEPTANKTTPLTPAPMPVAPPPASARPAMQSVDDMMASVRDKIGGPRAPATRGPSAPLPPVPLPPPPPMAARPDVRAPAPAVRPGLPQRSEGLEQGASSDPFDLGAPLPEERISQPARPARRPEGIGAADAGAGRRREPTMSAPPTPPAFPAPAQQSLPLPGRPGSAPPAAIPSGAIPPQHPRPAQAMPPVPPPPPVPQQAQRTQQAPAQPPMGPPSSHPLTPGAGRRNTLDAVNPGQLAEAIPRFMRAWVSERVEVRIARRSFDGLAVGIEGRGAPARHDIVITSAMSVRLKAPDGGFAIDTLTPETQWIENRPGLISSDDFASWRWTVRPMRSGRARLHLVVSARTAGPDGSTAETALPDQIIEIKVRTNFGLAAKRWGGWVAAAVIGGALGKFGEGGVELFRRISGL